VAGGTSLIPRTRLTALLAVVLMLHALALQWLAQQLEQQSALRAMAAPMFTRLLQPETPAAAPPSAPAAAPRATRKRAGITSVASSKAAPRRHPASDAVASDAAASPPEAPASDPVATPTPPDIAASASSPDSTRSTAATAIANGAAPAASAPDATVSTAAPAIAAASSPASSSADGKSALASWPVDTRLSYELGGYFRGDLHGDARVQWQREGDQYQTRVEIDLTLLASLTLTSQGNVTPQGLAPRIYEELRRSGQRITRLGDNSITLNDGRTVPRPDGVQDTASQFVELSHRFATGQDALEVGRSVSLWMARPGGLDLWTYDIVEREILQTPAFGPVEAYRLKPRPITNPRGNITAEIWFAPSLQYLPVRIRVHMGEATFVDLLVDKIEQR
jgi:hypothetical protein